MSVTLIQGLKYIVDVYLKIATSAISSSTFVRSFFGAGSPLFGTTMYRNLGVPWASSTPAFCEIAFVPIPVLFYVLGPRLRALSRSAIGKE